MVLAIALIIFVIGCCLDSFEQNSYTARKEAQRRHDELMRALMKAEEKKPLPARKTKVTRRRIAKDPQGNVLAEEVTEEEV